METTVYYDSVLGPSANYSNKSKTKLTNSTLVDFLFSPKRQINIQTDKQPNKQTKNQTDRQTDSQTNRQKIRRTDRQTDSS